MIDVISLNILQKCAKFHYHSENEFSIYLRKVCDSAKKQIRRVPDIQQRKDMAIVQQLRTIAEYCLVANNVLAFFDLENKHDANQRFGIGKLSVGIPDIAVPDHIQVGGIKLGLRNSRRSRNKVVPV